MNEIKIVSGGIFEDHRGKLIHNGDFDFDGVERYYFIKHDNTTVIRGWHGHQYEKKWFQCVAGAFNMALVAPNDWNNPSADLVPELFYVSDKKSEIVCVPAGYANCIRATEPNSILMVFSGKRYPECLCDSWRWEAQMWGGDKILL